MTPEQYLIATEGHDLMVPISAVNVHLRQSQTHGEIEADDVDLVLSVLLKRYHKDALDQIKKEYKPIKTA